ncbi:MAG: hypothetical protein CVU91_13410 [Firmicutes bacterium HGW-Firmicutes-16]|nr:MAG: hypothetical protein CVU91_13410 [Firmicutes bacterium HGW-Firmicutes-16]
MQSVEHEGLQNLDRRFASVLNKFPSERKELFERIAKRLEQEVGQQIYMSGVNDYSGKIEGWQKGRVGTGGGYAAVSAVRGKTGPNSPGAITNYLNSGHRIRPPGRLKRSRVHVAYVNGYHFYQYAAANAEAIAANEAEKLADELAHELGGETA